MQNTFSPPLPPLPQALKRIGEPYSYIPPLFLSDLAFLFWPSIAIEQKVDLHPSFPPDFRRQIDASLTPSLKSYFGGEETAAVQLPLPPPASDRDRRVCFFFLREKHDAWLPPEQIDPYLFSSR